MLTLAWIISALALVVLGARAARAGEGFSAGVHAAALLPTVLHFVRHDVSMGLYAGGAVFAIGAGHALAAIAIALRAKDNRTAALHGFGAVAIWAPWIYGMLGPVG